MLGRLTQSNSQGDPGTERAPGDLLNFRPSTRARKSTRRPHFRALSSRIFFHLPLHSNANKKVIDTPFTSVLYLFVFAASGKGCFSSANIGSCAACIPDVSAGRRRLPYRC